MNHKIFFVNKSEIEGRLDSEYYRPDISEIEAIIRQKSTKNLAHFAYFMASGGTPSVTEESYYSDKENGIPFLRVQNLTEQGVLNLDGLKYISKDVHENMLKRSQFDDQDLLVKITGVGRMAVASVPPLGFVGNTNQHMIVVKTKNRQISEYLANYLNLNIVEKLAKRRSTGGTRPALDYTALRSIPIIENLDFSKWDNAKMQAQNIQNQAQTLLSSISDYLLEQLGIVVPSVDNALSNRIFMTLFSELDERLDPNYYQDNYNQAIVAIKSGKYKTMPLNQLTDSVFQGVGRNLVDFSNYKLLKVKNIQKNNKIDIDNFEYISEFSQSKILESGDIITPCIGEAVRQIKFSTFNYDENDKNMYLVDNNTGVIRPNSLIIPDFLTYCLCSFIGKMQISRLIGGGGVPFLGAENLKKFIIPVPDLPTQKSIVQHINQIRQQAQALEQEAIDLLKQTQDDIEMMILG